MSLTSDLISQFVKATNDKTESKKESTVYGTAVENDGSMYVKLDGSDLLTPMSTTVKATHGERVMVTIKNHTATITGNITSPAARNKDVTGTIELISEFNTVLAQKVNTKDFETEKAKIETLQADNVTIKNSIAASEADIDTMQANNIEIEERLTAAEEFIHRESKILWGEDLTSGMHMTAGDTINLVEAVSAQKHGIVLVFCTYNGTDDTNHNWQSFFVPKQLVALSTSGHTFVLGSGKFTYTGTKYLYINDTSISGHDDNILTGSNNGITYANDKFVLRYVIGV